MIVSKRLLADLQRLLKVLEADIRERLEAQPGRMAELDGEWRAARDARRTAATQFEWREERITQAGVHWILGTVFLRFLEDNGYLERPFLFGPDAHIQALAIDRHARYFRDHPAHSDREYLLHCFADAAELPGLDGLFDPAHNPLYQLELSGDGAMALRDFWRRVDPDTGLLVHEFNDSAHGTRFLGDLYQDLSESARKRYALLQTPEFVEEFILDRTLTPAIEKFGYRVVRLIDPASGSGHFLLGAFDRLFAIWQREEPARNLPDLAQRTLDAVYGVDLNPFAVEIARFRMLISALNACGISRLREAPNFKVHVAAGDSLLHGRRFGQFDLGGEAENLAARYSYAYATEDLADLSQILGRQYHAVVANPPYITPKDAALNEIYRGRYSTCYMKYSLGVPFIERAFELALSGNDIHAAGFVGVITSNSFMKREFGKKLIEEYLPTVDLTHLVDTSGAYIPGHGTPTVILFGRNRRPVDLSVRTAMGIKGEPSAPEDAALGLVWQSILGFIDRVGSGNQFISVSDLPREALATHPWTIAGGGAAELSALLIENAGAHRLSDYIAEVGIFGIAAADDVLISDARTLRRNDIEDCMQRPVLVGEDIRDWSGTVAAMSIFPYRDNELVSIVSMPATYRWLWPYRQVLWSRTTFAKRSYREEGRPWWEWHQVTLRRIASSLSITFAFVATHNNFVLDRGGKVFKQSAPIIKLRMESTESDHLDLLGLLNSSVACFWLKQNCFDKGNGGIGGGISDEKWELRYEFNATQVAEVPIIGGASMGIASRLDRLACERRDSLPGAVAGSMATTRGELNAARERAASIRRQMVALQEELDWSYYHRYGLVNTALVCTDPPELSLGERAFEIVLARRVAAGVERSAWFERHGSMPITDLPAHWSADYRSLVERRIARIESDRNIALIERPEYKRRWNDEPWESQEKGALRDWLLDRLETERYWSRGEGAPLRSTSQVADLARTDKQFMQIAGLYIGHDAFDVSRVVADLVESEAVPFLPAMRYSEDGQRKRAAWELAWDLQRQEDATGERLDVPVPPKYKSSDFSSGTSWRLRGPLDVPKERFVSYPGASLDADGSLVVTWAGYDELQQAKAVAGHYLHLKDNHGWVGERLIPLLAGLAELLPWLKQWHNQPDPTMGVRMGEYFEGFVQDEARSLGVTGEEVRVWRPQAPVRGRRRRS